MINMVTLIYLLVSAFCVNANYNTIDENLKKSSPFTSKVAGNSNYTVSSSFKEYIELITLRKESLNFSKAQNANFSDHDKLDATETKSNRSNFLNLKSRFSMELEFEKSGVIARRFDRVRLTGGQLSYMGQVQLSFSFGRWGSICGEDWGVENALVTCRQLGYNLGTTFARPSSDFKNATAPYVISKVRCNGSEKRLDECPHQVPYKMHFLECDDKHGAAGVICGCSMDVKGVLSRCNIFTKSRFQRMSCRYTCPPGKRLVGSPRRSCESSHRWSGVPPRCVTEVNPCSSSPCQNEGSCQTYLKVTIDYICICPNGFGGKNCEFNQTWNCGVPNVSLDLSPVQPQLRIVGGRTTRKGSWPWIVQMRWHDGFFCGGTLIAPQYVMTAQHCFSIIGVSSGENTDRDLTVVSGQHYRTGHDKTSQVHHVAHIYSQDFVLDDIPRRDIALVRLLRPVTIDENTSPLCLPSSILENPLPRRKCWVGGWGATHRLGSAYSNTLQEANIPVVSNARCKSWSWRGGNFRTIDDNMLCAGYRIGTVDTCLGDSGGPFMCSRSDGSWYAAGVISWGYGCADTYSPGVMTRVSHYLNWIYDIIQRE